MLFYYNNVHTELVITVFHFTNTRYFNGGTSRPHKSIPGGL
jgi:hypothetical protein